MRAGGRTDGRGNSGADLSGPKSYKSEKKARGLAKLFKGSKTKGGGRERSDRPAVRPSAPAREVLSRLKELYPDARCALDHRNAYELLCATILSAQCTDARVNLVTPALFARYPTPYELARANPADVQEIIRPTGFFRNKTRSLIGMAQAVVADHGGAIPRTMEELRKLPGVGRKTANVVLGNAFNINEGVTVDTHVTRLSRLLGLSHASDPARIENELMELFPREDWGFLSHLLIFHGRRVCVARRPRCGECALARCCPSAGL